MSSRAAVALALLATSSACAQLQCEPTWYGLNGAAPNNGPYINKLVSWDRDGLGPETAVTVAGGAFGVIGSTTADNVATWDGSAWAPLGAELGAEGSVVKTLAVGQSNQLFAAGLFSLPGGSNVARWSGVQWEALGQGTNGPVHALRTMPNGDLIAGGDFTAAGGVAASRIARWDGFQWSALGAGLNEKVYALAVLPDGRLAAGGLFLQAGGVPAARIAVWDGSAWSDFGGSLSFAASTISPVYALEALSDGSLIAGGRIFVPGGGDSHRVYRGTAQGWTAIGSPLIEYVYDISASADGGLLIGTTLSTLTSAGGVFELRDGVWQVLEGGVRLGSAPTPAGVFSLLRTGDGDLAIGGRFQFVGSPDQATGLSRESRSFARFGSLCRCTADLDNDGNLSNGGDRDGAVTVDDLLFFVNAFEAGSEAADLDGDGSATIDDLLLMLVHFEAGC